MTKKIVRINASLLAPALRARFDTMMQVASRRSIVAWELSPSPRAADVVLRERDLGEDGAETVPIYLTDFPQSNDPNELRLPTEFRVAALMDALDLAAVRVMNRWDSRTRATPAARSATAAPVQYQLSHWVILPGCNDAAHVHTMATMTRRPVTREWMTTRGGLSGVQADALLAELSSRNALRRVTPAAEVRRAVPQIQPERMGLVGRLRRWLTGERTPAPQAS